MNIELSRKPGQTRPVLTPHLLPRKINTFLLLFSAQLRDVTGFYGMRILKSVDYTKNCGNIAQITKREVGQHS